MPFKMLLLHVAALGYNFLKQNLGDQPFHDLAIQPIQGLFPAVTCTVQATMRTALPPSGHGLVGNGFFFREQWKPLFWEQSSRLIEGGRIWDTFRSRGRTVAQMFIQQSLGPDSDLILSPAPIHKHHGGMILDCFSEPASLNDRLRKEMGSPFPLHSYWGPLASGKSSRWIAGAVVSVMKKEKPDFLYTYLPHLDYALQKYGPEGDESGRAFRDAYTLLGEIIRTAREEHYHLVVFGDYPITNADKVIFPNRVLRRAGLFKTRPVRGRHYPNFYTSPAFCMVDHQVAHLYLFEPGKLAEVKALMMDLAGVDKVLDRPAQAALGLDHARSGDLVLVAGPGHWFDYRWWEDKREAPDYAVHIDIHNKPGYDPCELFWGWPPPSISQNPLKIRGTHGRVDLHEPVFYASDLDLKGKPETILELSRSIKELLDESRS
ncbi:MAG: alkaline phosphatase family protein [bacterium]